MSARVDLLKIWSVRKRKKQGSHITIFTVICCPVFPSNLNLHGHSGLEDHLVAVILHDHPVQVADDQVVVEKSYIFIQNFMIDPLKAH